MGQRNTVLDANAGRGCAHALAEYRIREITQFLRMMDDGWRSISSVGLELAQTRAYISSIGPGLAEIGLYEIGL